MDIRKFFRPPPPQTKTARVIAEQENHIPAEKKLEEPTASEQLQLASLCNTEAQVPPVEPEHADFSANAS